LIFLVLFVVLGGFMRQVGQSLVESPFTQFGSKDPILSLMRSKTAGIDIVEVVGECPIDGGVIKVKPTPRGPHGRYLGFCEVNRDQHTYTFDPTTLAGRPFPYAPPSSERQSGTWPSESSARGREGGAMQLGVRSGAAGVRHVRGQAVEAIFAGAIRSSSS